MNPLLRPLEELKFKAMNDFRLEFDDLPDGAFFAFAEERHSWTGEDWLWFSKKFAALAKVKGKSA